MQSIPAIGLSSGFSTGILLSFPYWYLLVRDDDAPTTEIHGLHPDDSRYIQPGFHPGLC